MKNEVSPILQTKNLLHKDPENVLIHIATGDPIDYQTICDNVARIIHSAEVFILPEKLVLDISERKIDYLKEIGGKIGKELEGQHVFVIGNVYCIIFDVFQKGGKTNFIAAEIFDGDTVLYYEYGFFEKTTNKINIACSEVNSVPKNISKLAFCILLYLKHSSTPPLFNAN